MSDLYLALIHAPVYNKNGEVVATSITNLDLHDIARACMTYGIRRYYVVHPAEVQQSLAKRIMAFWQEGFGSTYNPNRQEAFSLVKLTSSLEEAIRDIAEETGSHPLTVATDARLYSNSVTYEQMRRRLEQESGSYLLLFGTGWGLLREDVAEADFILAPISGPSDYNHLSVRSAVSIILDRLRGH